MSVVIEAAGRRIVTKYDPKPVPCDGFDWSAVLEDYDGGDPIGNGATEDEAILDLLTTLDEAGL